MDGLVPSLTNRLERWFLETSTVYHVGMVRLSIGLLATGACSMILGGVLMALNDNHQWAGLGIWAGFPVFISGMVCLANYRVKSNRKCTSNRLMAGVSMVASLFLLITSAVNIYGVTVNPKQFYPSYTKKLPEEKAPLYIVNSLLLVLAAIQCLLSGWTISLALGYVWPCCKQYREHIYTISYDDGKETNLELDTADYAWDHFEVGDDRERVLQIDTNMNEPATLELGAWGS